LDSIGCTSASFGSCVPTAGIRSGSSTDSAGPSADQPLHSSSADGSALRRSKWVALSAISEEQSLLSRPQRERTSHIAHRRRSNSFQRQTLT
jgi:hypothetical protein